MGLSNVRLDKPGMAVPSETDAKLATESSRILSKLDGRGEFRVSIAGSEELVLPSAVRTLLMHVLTEMSRGNAVTIIPIHAEMTTQEAADFLNVSRPHVVKLIREKKIKHHMVGTHRRIRFEDLKDYQDRMHQESAAAMAELTEQAQELDMGY